MTLMGRRAGPGLVLVTCMAADKEKGPGQESSACVGHAFPWRRPGLVPKDITRTMHRA